MLTKVDLFAGIGAVSLAGEWAGFTTLAFVEVDPFCQKVLAKNFPGVPILGDIKQLTEESFRTIGVGRVDLLHASPPCQDLSLAGKREGKEGSRYLWTDTARIIDALSPTWVCIENVPGVIRVALDDWINDLGTLGYECVTFAIPASGVGAPHKRERVFIMAHAGNDRREWGKKSLVKAGYDIEPPRWSHFDGRDNDVADSGGKRRQQDTGSTYGYESQNAGFSTGITDESQCSCERNREWFLAHSASKGLQVGELPKSAKIGQQSGIQESERRGNGGYPEIPMVNSTSQCCGTGPCNCQQGTQRRNVPANTGSSGGKSHYMAHSCGERLEIGNGSETEGRPHSSADGCGEGTTESGVGFHSDGIATELDGGRRLAWNGFPALPGQPPHDYEPERVVGANKVRNRKARVKALGNAVVPQQIYPVLKAIAETIIMEEHNGLDA